MLTNLNLLIFYFILVSPSFFDVTHSQSNIGEIPLPSPNFNRIEIIKNGFADFLRNLPLKKPGSDVVNYWGGIFKSGADTSVAYVVDMDMAGRRLEQCMDILVRFYAEYLWDKKQVGNFILPIPGGHRLEWQEWRAGFRPVFRGIDVFMFRSAQPDSSLQSYMTFLNTVYSESHTQQFYHAYKPVERREVLIGDIIIKKGTKGHAIMIVDLAKNEHDELIALIGNGDTPACQFFLLNFKKDNPWIPLDFDQERLSLPLKRKMTWDGLRRLNLPED
jgi:hypothetical protein